MNPSHVPEARVRAVNDSPENPRGAYVLYWMIAARRTGWSFALDRAVAHCERLGLPLLVFEPLRCGHRWASQRIHRFVVDGMADNAARCAERGVAYFPYVEPTDGAGKGLLAALAARAAVVVTDTFPCFFLPRMVAAAGAALSVRLEEVDGNGIVPLRTPGKAFSRAFDFRRFLQRELPEHLDVRPSADPLADRPGVAAPRDRLVPADVFARWAPASPQLLSGDRAALHALPIDREVAPLAIRGGPRAGDARMDAFLATGLRRYADRNHPDRPAASQLSPYLHFGHVSAHRLVGTLLDDREWSAPSPPLPPSGARAGWWGLGEAEEGFLDQILTWRELGYGYCHFEPAYDRYESLPPWARTTMDEHRHDVRPERYSLQDLEAARTADPLWNAAQRQLREEGHIHNYLRMLWGKRIYEWSPSPEEAWRRLEHLNNRWAIDGRNPNSYSGIGWVMGRFDRAWGPERPVFGKLRYMTSANTRRKLELTQYLNRWGKQLPL